MRRGLGRRGLLVVPGTRGATCHTGDNKEWKHPAHGWTLTRREREIRSPAFVRRPAWGEPTQAGQVVGQTVG
jgi:hypothetical protein